jgi:tRNA(fMet)-specific endonuclease VapC
MLQFLFDTDHLTLYDHGQQQVRQRHATALPDAVGISAVTIQEYLRGQLAALARHPSGPQLISANANLLATLFLFQQFPQVDYDQRSDAQFQQLRALRLRVGTQDLKIASVALVNNLVLLTRNRRDFAKVPGLTVDDWSV